jgi:uncharacterized protein (DUF2141 family)
LKIGAAMLMAAALMPHGASAANVEVVVNGVRNDSGTVRVALCTEPKFLSFDCVYRAIVPAAGGTTTVNIADVQPGTYAAEVFHDDDNSGKLETSFLGFPRKGMGFSRDAPMRFGPPRFRDAALQVGAGGARITVTLHYPE